MLIEIYPNKKYRAPYKIKHVNKIVAEKTEPLSFIDFIDTDDKPHIMVIGTESIIVVDYGPIELPLIFSYKYILKNPEAITAKLHNLENEAVLDRL